MTIYKCRIRGQYNAVTNWSFGFHCEATAAESGVNSTLTSAWTALWNDATNGYGKFCTSAVTSTFAETATLNPSLRLLTKTSASLALAGTATGSNLPLQITPLICFTGAQDTKSDRGRMRLPVVAETEFQGGVWLAAFLTSLGTVFQTFWNSMNALAGFQVTSYNRVTNKQGDPPFTKHVLTNWNIPDHPGTARMRTRKIVPARPQTGTL